jgi:hypothetical protein
MGQAIHLHPHGEFAMSADPFLDAILIEWGDRLFYPGNRIVKAHTPRLSFGTSRAQMIRSRIEATVRRAPQVMVKVTGGGRGMRAIAAHFRYISRNGRLEIEDDRGVVERGKDALLDIERQWRFGGAYIDDMGHRREAFNVMLSMPRGTDPQTVLFAAREFAKIEFADHRYVMVLHDHQAHPHVHLTVKAESRHGQRLNPRKADLHRWRERFAEQLRERGIDAEATRQVTRGRYRKWVDLWQVKARQEGRLRIHSQPPTTGTLARPSREAALDAWEKIALALANSESREDRVLATEIVEFVRDKPVRQRSEQSQYRPEIFAAKREKEQSSQRVQSIAARDRKGPEIER